MEQWNGEQKPDFDSVAKAAPSWVRSVLLRRRVTSTRTGYRRCGRISWCPCGTVGPSDRNRTAGRGYRNPSPRFAATFPVWTASRQVGHDRCLCRILSSLDLIQTNLFPFTLIRWPCVCATRTWWRRRSTACRRPSTSVSSSYEISAGTAPLCRPKTVTRTPAPSCKKVTRKKKVFTFHQQGKQNRFQNDSAECNQKDPLYDGLLESISKDESDDRSRTILMGCWWDLRSESTIPPYLGATVDPLTCEIFMTSCPITPALISIRSEGSA